jgi:OmpA-OmpF porin, OOP family
VDHLHRCVATGGERYLELGCFDMYRETKKLVAPNTNDSRKAYYYIDNVSMTPRADEPVDITMVLTGNCFRLENLLFETDQAVILPESFEEMDLLARFLKTYPHLLVYIDGHTDKTGSDTHNDKLSADRAKAVKSYLVKSGVAESRLKPRSYGESQPVDTKNENSLTNRRVEITICAAPATAL